MTGDDSGAETFRDVYERALKELHGNEKMFAEVFGDRRIVDLRSRYKHGRLARQRHDQALFLYMLEFWARGIPPYDSYEGPVK